jgi:hypothetical protein
MIESVKKRVRILNQAEQVRQEFLVKGLKIANTAKEKFLQGGYKKVRKYAITLERSSVR